MAPEDNFDRTLRWMLDNVAGAYESVHPQGSSEAGKHRMNSGTCLLVCSYINALGKVLLKGGPPKSRAGRRVRRDFERFQEFLEKCMQDFLQESTAKALPPTPNGAHGGDEWLYEVFRCGFVHGFYAGQDGAWRREPSRNEYWLSAASPLVLNIDELVRGFRRGVDEFRHRAARDPDLRGRFTEYILTD